MLSVKQGGIKYHFLNLWYDTTWERTLVSQAIGEHSTHQANVLISDVFICVVPILVYIPPKCPVIQNSIDRVRLIA